MRVTPFTAAWICAAVLGPGLAAPARAALSGYWDSVTVLQAVLADSRIGDALRQQPVEETLKTETGITLKSRDCEIAVVVTRIPAGKPGPDSFTFAPGTAHCR